METLGQRIHRLRTARGLSLRDLDRLSGVSHRAIHAIEHVEDASGTKLSTVVALARALGLTPIGLLRGVRELDGEG